MKSIMSIAGLALVATTAAVDAKPFSAVLDMCLAASTGQSDDEACRDQVYDACLADSGDETTFGMATCLDAEYSAWDGVLNDLWPGIRASAEARDAAEPEQNGANLEALLKAQRAWIAFRDAECANGYQTFLGGSIRVLVAGSCLVEMTSGRVIQFRNGMAYATY